MRNKILPILKIIEKEDQVKILFAIESGSRLWRMDSKDSDFDVRFVFVQPIEKYISLDYQKNMDKVLNRMEGDIDLCGFDIFKFCDLLLKSNPSVIEWLQSDILYYGTKPKILHKIALTQFNPKALYYHYKSMCNFNYNKYIASKRELTYKKYLYAMRGLVNAKYVEHFQTLPPISFPECLVFSKKYIPSDIIEGLQKIIEFKKRGQEKDIQENNVRYDEFIEQFLQLQGVDVPERKMRKESVDKELRKLVLEKNI